MVSTCLGIYFYSEGTSLVKFAGIIAILLSIVILNIKNVSLEKNHFYGLAAGFFYGICFVIDKGTVATITPAVYVFWLFLLSAFLCFMSNPKEVVVSIRNESFPTFKIIILTNICFLLYNLLTYTAYTAGGEVGKVDAINSSQIFLIILFEYFILKHKGSIGRKLLAATIAFAGVLIIGVYQ
ncbi:MAG: EamA family transporter [Patescibacteria group bacterium]